MKDKPILSVVIPTYNRCEVLQMVLDRLEKQAGVPDRFEIIVVDDGSTDGTCQMVQGRIANSVHPLRYLQHENRGPGYTQNRGIQEAGAELILIIADDVLPSEALLKEHLHMHARYPAAEVAVLGRVMQSGLLPQTVFQRNWDPFRYDRLAGKKELPSIYFFGCNISFKKRFVIENGLFLECRGAAHEDIELGYRLGQKGLKIIYCEQALGFHHHEETFQGACRRAYERGWNFDLLSKNIPESYILPIYSVLSPQAGIKAFMKMLPRGMVLGLLFNRITVGWFWKPILEKANGESCSAFFANSFTFRGVANYYFRSGYADKKKKTKNAP